jgi:phosphoribosylformylglycinamidine synthase
LYGQFNTFRKNTNKFILGVCNGCQLLVRLGWLQIPNLKIVKNDSNRFESRQVTVKITPNNSLFLKDFDDTILPIHIAHTEGKIIIENDDIPKNQIVMEYYDSKNNQVTNKYPLSPNGSNIAGLCDPSGRILAMMPHPERCFRKWQFHWLDRKSKESWKESPWLKLFRNCNNYQI